MATDFDKIPIVNLMGEDPARAILDGIDRAGFFYVANHGVDPAAADAAFAAAEQFFAQPDVVKAEVSVDQNQRGWSAIGGSTLEGSQTYDAKEVFFWGWEHPPGSDYLAEDHPLVAPNRWPTDGALRAGINPYYRAICALGDHLLSLLATALALPEDFFTRGYERPLGRGQLVYYPALEARDRAEQRFSAAPHSDFGVLTILKQGEIGGLEVRNRAGDWIAARPIEGTLVCNIGDLLAYWTNGRLKPTVHRVINASGQARYSIPIFYDPTSEFEIDPKSFDRTASALPITAGAYITGKNRKNFAHYAASPTRLPLSIK